MPAAIVDSFIQSIEAHDLDRALALLSDDCEYDNVPVGKVVGPEGVRATLAPFLGMFEEVRWVVTHQVSSGSLDAGVVMNERLDRFRTGDRWLELPVAGLFVVRHSRIALWRDYFDKETLLSAMAALG